MSTATGTTTEQTAELKARLAVAEADLAATLATLHTVRTAAAITEIALSVATAAAELWEELAESRGHKLTYTTNALANAQAKLAEAGGRR